jgi:hypothetical protein
MGMFNIQFINKIKLSYGNIHLFEFLKKQLQKDKTYQNRIEETTLTVEKCRINTLLRYNLDINIHTDKRTNISEITVNGQLHDSLLLTVFILLSILFTYGLGIILVIGFTFYQKVIATKQLKELIHNYKSTI